MLRVIRIIIFDSLKELISIYVLSITANNSLKLPIPVFMKTITSYPIPIILLALLLIIACRRSAVAPFDPCKDAVPFKAGLQISEIRGDSLVETDTVLINTTVSFKATSPLLNYATFEYQIGGAPAIITEKKEVSLYFDDRNVSPGELIKVRLIAKGKPNLACFPNDKSVDTIEKSFRIIHWKDAPIIGKYAGYFGSDINKTDKQVVEVRYLRPDSLYTYGSFELFNIDKGCNSTITNPYLLPNPYNVFFKRTGARFMVFIGDSGPGFANSCHAPSGVLQLNHRDTITAKFTYSKSLNEINPRINETFNGVRIK